MTGFLTLEDINGTRFREQGFYWHEIDTAVMGDQDFSNVKLDFCTVSRETYNNGYIFTFQVDNEYFTGGAYVINSNGELENTFIGVGENPNPVIFTATTGTVKLYLYLGIIGYEVLTPFDFKLLIDSVSVKYNQINSTIHVDVVDLADDTVSSTPVTVNVGFNQVNSIGAECGFLLVNLVKSDFQFNCNQSLTVGKINKVALGTDSDYLPSGDMIGDNTPNITIMYGDTYIPVTFDSDLNDYIFNLDLTSKQNEGNIRFKVLIEANDVINETSTDVILQASYENINTEAKLLTLMANGGTGRIGADLTLTDDITISNDVYIIGNDKTLTMDSHKIIVPSDKTFKASNITITGGENTIQQNTGSKVELTNCSFTDCTGLGSVIDCQVDIGSLSNATDFTTVLNECSISNCDMAILHGGELTIDNCNITGKVSDANNPYALYQTDGTATILRTQFTLTSETQIESDIGFNPCIFICGTEATINGLGHTDLQNNDINSFLEAPQYNSSTIDITYLHSGIEDYIRLQSDNGYCHAVSSVDKIYKTSVIARRVE